MEINWKEVLGEFKCQIYIFHAALNISLFNHQLYLAYFQIKVIQKCHICQLCVDLFRENSSWYDDLTGRWLRRNVSIHGCVNRTCNSCGSGRDHSGNSGHLSSNYVNIRADHARVFHKLTNLAILAKFAFSYICSFLLYLQHMMLVNLKIDIKVIV